MKLFIISIVVSVLAMITNAKLAGIINDLERASQGLPPKDLVFPDHVPEGQQEVRSKLPNNAFEEAPLIYGLDSQWRRFLVRKDPHLKQAAERTEVCEGVRRVCRIVTLFPLWAVMLLGWMKLEQLKKEEVAKQDANHRNLVNNDLQQDENVVS